MTILKKSVSKKTGIGEELDLVEKQKARDQQFRDNMIDEIQALVNKAKQANSTLNIYFLSINNLDQ